MKITHLRGGFLLRPLGERTFFCLTEKSLQANVFVLYMFTQKGETRCIIQNQ